MPGSIRSAARSITSCSTASKKPAPPLATSARWSACRLTSTGMASSYSVPNSATRASICCSTGMVVVVEPGAVVVVVVVELDVVELSPWPPEGAGATTAGSGAQAAASALLGATVTLASLRNPVDRSPSPIRQSEFTSVTWPGLTVMRTSTV